MSSPIELPVELGGLDKVNAGLAQVEQKTAAAATSIQSQLKKAFAANVLVGSLNQLGSKLDDTSQKAIAAATTIASGFLQGGPVGLAFSAAATGAGLLIEHLGKAKREAEATAAAMAAEFKIAADAANDQQKALSAVLERAEAIRNARQSHLKIEEELELIQRRNVEASLNGLDAAIAGIEGQLAKIADKRRRVEHDTFSEFARLEREKLDAQRDSQAESLALLKQQRQTQNTLLATMDEAHRNAMNEKIAAEEEAARQSQRAKRIADREAFAREEIAFLSKQAGDRAEAELRAARDLDARLREIEDNRQRDEWDRELRQEADDRARMEREIADAAWLAEQIATQSRTAEEARRAAARETAQAIGEEIQREIDERARLDAAVASAVEDVARNLLDMVTAEGELSKAHLERIAKQSALEAAFNVATGFARLALLDKVGATAAFIAAGKYAAIAGGAAIGSAVTPAAAAEPERERGGRASSGGFGRGGRGGEGAGVTVIMPAGQLFLTRADTSRAIADGVREAQRRA
jgi:hypothetical protein